MVYRGQHGWAPAVKLPTVPLRTLLNFYFPEQKNSCLGQFRLVYYKMDVCFYFPVSVRIPEISYIHPAEPDTQNKGEKDDENRI